MLQDKLKIYGLSILAFANFEQEQKLVLNYGN